MSHKSELCLVQIGEFLIHSPLQGTKVVTEEFQRKV